MAITRYNYFFLFLFINWAPFQLVLFRAQGIGFIIVAFAMIAFILNLFLRGRELKHVFSDKPQVLWLILISFMCVNWWQKAPPLDGMGRFTFLYGEIITPIITMVVVLLDLNKNYLATLKVLLLSLCFFVLVGLIFAAPDENDSSRMLASNLGNLVPINAAAALFISFELKRRKRIKDNLLPLVVFLMFAIFISSTRKALGASLIIIAGYIISKGEGSLRNRIIQILAITTIGIGVFYLVSNLGFGARFAQGFDSGNSVQLFTNSEVNKFANMIVGDRAAQYLLSFELIPHNLWTGIGLRNFEEITNYPVQLHTEYMVQLCENGIIGFTLSITIYLALIFRFIKLSKGDSSNKFYLFGVFTILFLNFTSWTYNMIYAVALLAMLMIKSNPQKYEIKKFKAKQLGSGN